MTEKKSPDLFPDSETISDGFDGAPGQKISLSGILPGQIIRSMIESEKFGLKEILRKNKFSQPALI